MPSSAAPDLRSRLAAYVAIARIDHWFKNAFMLLGVVVALFYAPDALSWSSVPRLALALLATCLVASSNYVINELLDAPHDRLHPVKKSRPAAAGLVRPAFAIAEWLLLAAVGIGLATLVNRAFALSAAWLWGMGVVYNVRPLRTKELPYLDVLSESVNNPIRLLLGWFPVVPDKVAPVSLLVAYWMVGAFFMAVKRLGELRRIGDREVAAAYRSSFRHYTESRLLVSSLLYATLGMLFGGIFIVRYHLELIVSAPFAAGFLAYYLHVGLLPDSPVQNPEKLYRQRGFFAYTLLTVALLVLTMFVRVPVLYRLFNVEASRAPALWTAGER